MRTPRYGEKVRDALHEAYKRREREVELTLLHMLEAMENDRYDDLPRLGVALPERYRALVGSPPADRADDPPP